VSEKELRVFGISKKEFQQFKKSRNQSMKKISSELKPFLDLVRNMDKKSKEYKSFLQVMRDYGESMERAFRIVGYVMKDVSAMSRDIKSGKISELTVKDIVYLIFLYLGLIESIGNRIADILVMLLVANGRDFHIECLYTTPRIKHAVSLRDLEKERVSLTTKLNFLKENGISEVTSIIDSELRNAIAHLKIDIRKGMIYMKGQPATKECILGLSRLSEAIEMMQGELLKLAKDLKSIGQ